MLIDCDGTTVTGKERDTNKDQFLISDLNKAMTIHKTSLAADARQKMVGEPQGKLLVVADGVDGHLGGKMASSLAVESIIRYVVNTMPWFYSLGSKYTYEVHQQMKEAFATCRSHIKSAAEILNSEGMGTTLTMGYILWPRLYLIHVGDTRAYLFREKKLEQITTDHTIAAEMQAKEGITVTPSSPFANVLLDAIGMDTEADDYEGIKTEFKAIDLKLGDVLLMCSNGLSNYVNEQKMISAIRRTNSANAICMKLIAAALEDGSTDDITIIATRFGDEIR